MRYFLDTEFHDAGRDGLQLISIALVRQDGGKEFYAVSSEFDPEMCHSWVKLNVLPKLTGVPVPDTRDNIRKALEAFIGQDGESPEFWGYFADYDWVLFCQLWGRMLDLPKGWPHLCFDLRQEMARWGLTKDNFPPQDRATQHHALHDARWERDAWMLLQRQPPSRVHMRWL